MERSACERRRGLLQLPERECLGRTERTRFAAFDRGDLTSKDHELPLLGLDLRTEANDARVRREERACDRGGGGCLERRLDLLRIERDTRDRQRRAVVAGNAEIRD